MSQKTLTSMLLGGAAMWLLSGNKKGRHNRAVSLWSSKRPKSRDAADETTRRFLMYVVMPVWSFVGFLDWLWHRQTKIETTSGVKESIMHLIMMAEAGTPILTGLFLEMNAGALALMGAGWLLHEMTVAFDVKYTISRRPIFTREQSTHGYMQTIPFNIVVTLACLHPEQAKSLIGLGSEKPDFTLRFRKPPVPLKDFAAIVTTMGVVSFLPHVEELWRCYRAQQKGIAGRDIPECAETLYGT